LRVTRPDNEPVDPTTQQNHWGSSDRNIVEFRLLWEFGTWGWATPSEGCRWDPLETIFDKAGFLDEPGTVT